MLDNIVLASYVEETNSLTLHGTPLGEHNYRVAVEIAFNDNAHLPLPNNNISASLIGHVIGSFVAWPKFLVLFDDMMVNTLSFSLFCLIKNILFTLILLSVDTDSSHTR